MIIYINNMVKSHKRSLAKYILDQLIDNDYSINYVDSINEINPSLSESIYYIEYTGQVLSNKSYGRNTLTWGPISCKELYLLLLNKTEYLPIEQWREIFAMAGSADFSTANLSFRLIKNIHRDEIPLAHIVLMVLNKFKNNKSIQDKYPDFSEELDYLNRLLLPIHLQHSYEELSIDLLVNTIRNINGNTEILKILNDQDIKKYFTRKYDHWLNINVNIKQKEN